MKMKKVLKPLNSLTNKAKKVISVSDSEELTDVLEKFVENVEEFKRKIRKD